MGQPGPAEDNAIGRCFPLVGRHGRNLEVDLPSRKWESIYAPLSLSYGRSAAFSIRYRCVRERRKIALPDTAGDAMKPSPS